MNFKTSFLVLSVGLLTGCAYNAHNTKIAITTPTVATDVADGTELSLDVLDDRDSEVIGKRMVVGGGKITADNLMPLLETALLQGFKAKGFNIVSNDRSSSRLVVKLRAFKYEISQGFFTGGEDISVVLKVDAKKSGKELNKTYRFSNEERKIIYSGAGGLNEDLNKALNACVAKLLNDGELDVFLTSN